MSTEAKVDGSASEAGTTTTHLEALFRFGDIEDKAGFPVHNIRTMMRPGCTEAKCVELITDSLKSLEMVVVDGKWVKAKDHPTIKVTNYFNKRVAPYRMTLLMVLAARGYVKAIFLLLGKVNLDTQDTFGWSALHYAAIVNRLDVCALLVGVGADASLVNNRNGTYRELHSLAYRKCDKTLPNGLTYCPFLRCEARILVSDRYTPVVSLTLTDEQKADQAAANALYSSGTQKYEIIEFEEVGHCARTTRKVEAGALLWFYSGEVIENSGKMEDSHLFQTPAKLGEKKLAIDARRIGNAGALMPDGMPSVTYGFVRSIHGAPFAIVVAAMTDMDSGSIPMANYGITHSVKDEWVNAAPDYTRARVKELSIDKYTPLDIAQADFLFDTPSLLLELFAEGVMNSDNTIQLAVLAKEYTSEDQHAFRMGVSSMMIELAKKYTPKEIMAIFSHALEVLPKPHTRNLMRHLFRHIQVVTDSNEEKLLPEAFLKDFATEKK